MHEDESIIRLWQSQPLPESKLDMQLVISQASKFQRQIRFRNIREYLGCGIIIAWSAYTVLRTAAPPVIKAGDVLLALGAVFIAAIIRLRGHAAQQEPPLTAATRETMSWHRSELVRQRDLLRTVPLWYLGPLVPGVATILVGAWLVNPARGLPVAFAAACVAVVFGVVALLNRRAARKLDGRIAELERTLDA